MFFFVRALHWLRRSRGFALAIVGLMVVVAILGNALCFHYFDGTDERTFEDALWYSVISITTIGYGDYSAQSTGARVGTFIFIVVIGLTAFTILLGMFADFLTEFAEKGRRGMSQIVTEGHIIIVNFPGAARVRQIIRELQCEKGADAKDIVLVTDAIDALPFTLPNVAFVQGSPFDPETYKLAHLEGARDVLVLATDYASTESDAVVSSIVAMIEKIRPEVYTVAECLEENHKVLFESTSCDSIVCGPQLSSNLLTQEMHDPGVARTMEVITSNRQTPTLYSTEVSGDDNAEYTAIAKGLLDQGSNVISVIRGEETHTSLKNLRAQRGDRIIYVSDRRIPWNTLAELA